MDGEMGESVYHLIEKSQTENSWSLKKLNHQKKLQLSMFQCVFSTSFQRAWNVQFNFALNAPPDFAVFPLHQDL